MENIRKETITGTKETEFIITESKLIRLAQLADRKHSFFDDDEWKRLEKEIRSQEHIPPKAIITYTVKPPGFKGITKRFLAFNDVGPDDDGFSRLDIPVEIGDVICIYRGNTPSKREQRIDYLRSLGWTVAVHNDYRQNGEFHTFWLLTHPNGRYLKGEGRSDDEALEQIAESLCNLKEGFVPQISNQILKASHARMIRGKEESAQLEKQIEQDFKDKKKIKL